MSNLFDLLQKIEKNPGIYIARPSVSDLSYVFGRL
jgi:hypothetical protein